MNVFSKKAHKVYDKKWHRKNYKKAQKSKNLWVPSKKEIRMFERGEMTATQWKKYFGLKTESGVYKKLGQLAMYVKK